MSAQESIRRRGPREGNLAGAIYGQIVVTSTLVVSGAEGSLGAWRVLATVLATMGVLWVAHVYSELIAERVRIRRTLTVSEVTTAAARDWPLVQAAVPAAFALVLAAWGLWSRDTGVTVGLSLGVLSLLGWGVTLGRRSGFSWPRSLLSGAFSSGLALLIIALELLVH